jgi:hypothetical protein
MNAQTKSEDSWMMYLVLPYKGPREKRFLARLWNGMVAGCVDV